MPSPTAQIVLFDGFDPLDAPAVAGAVEDLFEHERRGTVWQNRGRTSVLGKRVVA